MNASPLEIFRSKGIPHRRMEDWKYTDLRQVLDEKSFENDAFGAVMTIANPSPEIELVVGDEIPDWAVSIATQPVRGAMDAAARAFGPNVAAIRVPGDLSLTEPLRIDFNGGGNGRLVLLVERGATLSLVESHHADWDGLRNVAFSIVLQDGAKLTHIRDESFGKKLVTVETIDIHLGRAAQYRAHFASGGAKLARTDLDIVLAGEGADANLSSVSVLGDGAHADLTTHIDHKVGHTTSTQLFKTVAGGKSRGIYQGRITVREGADGSDSRQTAKGLLLGPRAEIDLKPELEILADDVKCAHGAAVGDLDMESLFYLRSRGIPEAEARALLIRAFLEEAVEGIAQEDIRARMWEFVEEGLARAMETAP